MLCIKGLSVVSAFHDFALKMVLNRVFGSVRLNAVRRHMIKRFLAGTNVTFSSDYPLVRTQHYDERGDYP